MVSYTHANNDGKPARTDYANGIYIENVYDDLDKTVGIKYNGIVRYSVTYNFYQNNTYRNYNYAYYDNGNIWYVRNGTSFIASFQYDGLNQLTNEYNREAGRNYQYEYDLGKNITSVKTYNGSTLESTDTYSYTDTNWPDKLTAYNSVPFTYDMVAILSKKFTLSCLVWGSKAIGVSYENVYFQPNVCR